MALDAVHRLHQEELKNLSNRVLSGRHGFEQEATEHPDISFEEQIRLRAELKLKDDSIVELKERIATLEARLEDTGGDSLF